jgi:methionine--tRNA ligase beta chain
VKKVEDVTEELFPLNLKIAQINEVKDHPNADKLYVLQVDLENEKRQLVAGLKEHYTKEQLKNKKVIVMTNIKYAKLRGIESQGMLLAGDDGKDLGILTVKKSKTGSDVFFSGLKNLDKEISFENFQKLKITVNDGKAYYKHLELKTAEETVKVEKVKDGARVG